MQWLQRIVLGLGRLLGINNSVGSDYRGDELPDRALYRKSIQHPWLRKQLIDCSIREDEENSYYSSLLTTVAEHCLGTMPRVRLSLDSPDVEDIIEDKWVFWGSNNEIGSALRRLRRDACLTGIGIAIPYTKETALDEVKLCLRNIPSTRLKSPRLSSINDRIINGIEYDANWDPIKIYIENDEKTDLDEYEVKDILLWYKNTEFIGTPECGPAFTMYPSIKRYLAAVVRGEELRESIALGIEQDPNIYMPTDKKYLTGKFEYEPGQVLALPPGTKLTGISGGSTSGDKTAMLKTMVAAAARCVNMPGNLALGDSSGHNMATAQVDIQPWKIRVDNDRFDFQPMLVKAFWFWYKEARLVQGYFKRKIEIPRGTPFEWSYNVLFHHPDPGKMASARATDLASGAATLSMIYDSIDKKARRELEKEAKMLKIPVLELYKIILESRTKVPVFSGSQDDNQQQQ